MALRGLRTAEAQTVRRHYQSRAYRVTVRMLYCPPVVEYPLLIGCHCQPIRFYTCLMETSGGDCKDETMRIGILGTGIVGQTLGLKLVQLGHTVMLGTRAPSQLDDAERPRD